MKPPVPANLDLRDFPYMPLDVVRLRDSDIAALATGDAFRAAVLLWCAAWHQVPASSLPADDLNLARYSGYGRDVQGWLTVKEQALRGFDVCDDGRLYHSVIASKAIEADEKRRQQRRRTESATAERQRRRNGERNDKRHAQRNEVQGKGRDLDDDGEMGARISNETFSLADEVAKIAGIPSDHKSWPPGWCGAPMRIQGWINHGWPREIILLGARTAMAGKKDGPPSTVNYFEKPIAQALARQQKPIAEPNHVQATERHPGGAYGASKDRFREARAKLKAFAEQDDSEGGGSVIELLPAAGRERA